MLRWAILLASCATATTMDRPPPMDWVAPLVLRGGIPLVRVLVSGQPAWMVVDSGASYHFITDTLAREANLVTAAAREQHEVAGRRQEVHVSTNVRIEVGSWNLVAEGVLVTDLSRLGSDVRGLLSPQWIPTRGGTVAVDFVAKELRWLPGDEAQRRYATWIPASDGLLKSCLPETRSTLYGVHARIVGTETDLRVDTGSAGSTIESTSAVGQRVIDSALPTQPIALHRVNTSTRTELVKRPDADPCWYDGVLGADALANCALLFDGAGARLVCRQNLAAHGS